MESKNCITITTPERAVMMREAIAVSKARVIHVATELKNPDTTEEQAFSLMWQLGNRHLRDLEDFRNGGAH